MVPARSLALPYLHLHRLNFAHGGPCPGCLVPHHLARLYQNHRESRDSSCAGSLSNPN